MKILLVGNYVFDGSYSMQLFARVMYEELSKRDINVKLVAPRPFWGRIYPGHHGIGKWLGYIDRFVLFPFYLGVLKKKYDIVHFCDHGSSVYIGKKWRINTVVTCHDMLAVRGALGEISGCKPSFFGVVMQKKIIRGMKMSAKVACVSRATLADTKRILDRVEGLCVVSNGLNYEYHVISQKDINYRLQGVIAEGTKYIIHVGTNLPRKNRQTVIRAFSEIPHDMNIYLVIVGRMLDDDLIRLAKSLNVQNRIIQIYRPEVKILEALYNNAIALLFPSYYEGFGWPVVEAQACGCPVIASDIDPFVEILGDTAIICGVEAYKDMSRGVVSLCINIALRKNIIQKGLQNVQMHYMKEKMIDGYIDLYRGMICEK